MAVDTVITLATTRALSQALADREAEVAALDEEKVAESLARLAVSKGMAETSEELAQAGSICWPMALASRW